MSKTRDDKSPGALFVGWTKKKTEKKKEAQSAALRKIPRP